jgi:hypothetical protein
MSQQTETLNWNLRPAQHRLDPTAMPLRFAAVDPACDDGRRSVLLDSDRVVLARRLGPVAMKIALPVASYRGVALRIVPGVGEGEDRMKILLAHRDRALDVMLFETEDDCDVIAEWRLWASTLGLPLLIEGEDGHLVAAESRVGGVVASAPRARRRYAFLSSRRPRFLTRRRMGAVATAPLATGEDDAAGEG